MSTIGFIGLGLMGAGFTKRLVASGHTVRGYDLDHHKVEAARAWGVTPAGSPSEAAADADLVCICVTTTAAMEDVVARLCAGDGLGARIVADFSTCEMDATKRAAEAVARAGGAFIDAPVSGGPGAAETGTLAIMAGGDAAAIEEARPVLEQLGQLTHMGPTGTGQATKLVNQVLCLTNYCIVAEGLRLAQAYGVDARKIPQALAPGLANSAVLQAIYPRMVDGDFAPRGYARQVLKDFEMLHAATRDMHLPLPMTAQATSLFRMLVAGGKGELDGAAVVTLLPEIEPGAGTH
jgi:3-hydroxyisobutyrate dehydrogenase-like beta-hydroxyacid dehydrogenase